MTKLLKKLFYNNFNYFYWKEKIKNNLIEPTEVIETEKGPVEYKLIGNKGPVITSIHGAPGDWYQFYYICNGIPAQEFRLLTWSRPGYIRTPLESGIDNESQADLLAALLKKLNISKTSIIAFSNGGPIALEFAIKHKDFLDALIMEAAVTQEFKMRRDNIVKKFIDIFMLNSNPGSWLTYISTKLFPNNSSIMLLYRYGEYSLKELFAAFKKLKSNYNNFLLMYEFALKSIAPADMKKNGIKNDTVQSLKINFTNLDLIKIPVLIIHGTKDGDVSIKHSEFLAKQIPHAEYHRIEGAPHLVSFTDAESVTKLKLDFLKKSLSSSFSG